mgnify:CR=1 FL=1
MRRLEEGQPEARKKWAKLLQKRKATGEPYIMFKGNTNKANPKAYKYNSLKVHMTIRHSRFVQLCLSTRYIDINNIHWF